MTITTSDGKVFSGLANYEAAKEHELSLQRAQISSSVQTLLDGYDIPKTSAKIAVDVITRLSRETLEAIADLVDPKAERKPRARREPPTSPNLPFPPHETEGAAASTVEQPDAPAPAVVPAPAPAETPPSPPSSRRKKKGQAQPPSTSPVAAHEPAPAVVPPSQAFSPPPASTSPVAVPGHDFSPPPPVTDLPTAPLTGVLQPPPPPPAQTFAPPPPVEGFAHPAGGFAPPPSGGFAPPPPANMVVSTPVQPEPGPSQV